MSSRNRFLLVPGTEYLYGLLIQLLGFDKKYAIENPGYEKIAAIYNSYNVKYHYIPMDEKGILVNELENSGADVVHISPSHHFPTGIVTPISRRYELLGWAAASANRYIIEDDYDSEFRLTGKPIPSLQSMDITQKVIYINTFTKESFLYYANQLYGTPAGTCQSFSRTVELLLLYRFKL